MFGQVPATNILPTNLPRSKIVWSQTRATASRRAFFCQVTFRSFLRDDASQIHSFLKLCCCSSFIDPDLFIRRLASATPGSGPGPSANPRLGPELRGQVRLIQVFGSQRRALAAVLPSAVSSRGLRESKYRQGGPAAPSDSKPFVAALRPNPQTQGDEGTAPLHQSLF